MPLVKARMGDACASHSVDKGSAGGAPGQAAAHVAMGHPFRPALGGVRAAMAQHGPEVMGDIPSHTDLAPLIQISEVVVG